MMDHEHSLQKGGEGGGGGGLQRSREEWQRHARSVVAVLCARGAETQVGECALWLGLGFRV